MRSSPPIVLHESERAILESWAAQSVARPSRALRAEIILLAASGKTSPRVARALGVHPETVHRWRRRFLGLGLEGIQGTAPRPHPRSPGSRATKELILQTTLHVPPPGGGKWSTRSLARELKVSHMLVHRVWQTYGIGKAATRASGDPAPRTQTPLDLLGLYARGPWKAFVFGTGVERPRFRVLLPLDESLSRWPVAGGLRSPDPRRLSSALVDTLGQASRILGHGFHGLEEDFPGFLTFLRGVDNRASTSSRFYLVHEALPRREQACLESWLDSHPRFGCFPVPEGRDGLATVEKLVRLWALNPDLRLDLSNLGLLREALRQAAPSAAIIPGLGVWTPPLNRSLLPLKGPAFSSGLQRPYPG